MKRRRKNLISLFPQRKKCTKKYVKVVRQTDDFIQFMQKTQRELKLEHVLSARLMASNIILYLYLYFVVRN